ncbi:26S proteasome non-ATPase regulatory subunit 10 [Cytospora mali]|uniref:26S proteasome non-ATPase regulatory subunit 10 n=1 Tax=Cytospora mali TaxID=578113 RepID=A0A194V0I3_CYTMA|nr:26S proteasome non-ATPase regulatory subunit 10 [Valsa mali var. pyri (nom. inval.)]
MFDPITALQSVSSIIQLIGNLSKGLRSLRDTVTAIKDAPTVIKQIDDQIQHLGKYLGLVDTILKQHSAKIPCEVELHRLIQDLANNCLHPLGVLEDKLGRLAAQKNIVKAFHLWLDDNSIKKALNLIDEYTKYLSLLLQTLNFFKLDDVDTTLRQLANLLGDLQVSAKPRQLNLQAALSEDDQKAHDTALKIRAYANNAATTLAAFQAVGLPSLPTRRPIDALGTNIPDTTLSVSPGPSRMRKRREVDNEMAQNRKVFMRLTSFGLFEGAVGVQRRAFDLKDELASDHGEPFTNKEEYAMKEELVDILVECRTEGSTEEALALLQELLDVDTKEHHPLLVPPSSFPSHQGKLSLHHKLGQLCKDTNRLDMAMEHLRIAFDAYADATPKNTQKINEIALLLRELYENRVEFGGTVQRGVFISQLQGFRNEWENVTGRPLEQREACDEALDWCREMDILVPEVNQEYRFDIMDDDGSSPLHRAAQKCHKEIVIRQMLEDSDDLEGQDDNGDTPLLVAVGSSNMTALSLLLQKGGSLKARDRQFQTPLHRSQKSEVTGLLLQHRLRRASTMTVGPIEKARRDSSSSSTVTVSPAIPVSDQDLDINAQDATKKTALYIACARGWGNIVKLLLLAGADPNIARHSHSPLAAAIESQSKLYQERPKRKVDVIVALINKGADPEAVKNLRNLRNPTGIFKEIQKVLGGRSGSLPLSLSGRTLDVWEMSSGRGSGEQSSLSSDSTGVRLELPDLSPISLADLMIVAK